MMIKKFLKDSFLSVAGKTAEDIAEILDTKKHVNEFVLAKKLDLTINQTRNLLYKLSDKGLLSSIRKKDKRKGWYTYFWKTENLRALEFLKEELLKKIDALEHQVKSRETKRFYVCERCHIEMSEENALVHNFTCPECGAILDLKDNTKLVNEMNKNLDKMKKELELIDEEISKETEIIDKQKTKEQKKEEKKKKEQRAAKRRETKRRKEKQKAAAKKPVKEKTKSREKKKAKKAPKGKTGKRIVKSRKSKNVKKSVRKISNRPKGKSKTNKKSAKKVNGSKKRK